MKILPKSCMKYKLLSIAIIMLISVPAIGFPSGKIYGTIVPPYLSATSSIIIHDGKEEILILQATFENETHGKEIKDFGWIIPLPEEPELSTLDQGKFRPFFRVLTCKTHPITITKGTQTIGCIDPIPSVVIYSAICLSVIFFSMFLFRFIMSFLKEKNQRRSPWTALALSAWLFFIAIGNYEVCAPPPPIPAASKPSPGLLSIGIDKFIGDHVVKVLKPDKIDYLLNWLDEQNYRYDKKDEAVFQEYTNRGWCFVAVRISPKPINSDYYSRRGILKPIIFCFRSAKPIYPIQLRENAMKAMELAVYVISEYRVQTDGRLPVKFAGLFELPHWLKTHFMKSPPFWMEYRFKKIKYLTKFEGKLNPEHMKADLIFEQAPDNSSHHETVTVTIHPDVTREDLEALGRWKFFYSRILPLIMIVLVALAWEWISRKKSKISGAKQTENGLSNNHKGQ